MQWYLKVLKNYVNFNGRARRKEYWMFYLIHTLALITLLIVDTLIGIPGLLTGLYSLAVILPALALTVRRLHDVGKSGWWILISFVPFVGSIILLVFECLDSDEDNKYGLNPKTSQTNVAA